MHWLIPFRTWNTVSSSWGSCCFVLGHVIEESDNDWRRWYYRISYAVDFILQWNICWWIENGNFNIKKTFKVGKVRSDHGLDKCKGLGFSIFSIFFCWMGLCEVTSKYNVEFKIVAVFVSAVSCERNFEHSMRNSCFLFLFTVNEYIIIDFFRIKRYLLHSLLSCFKFKITVFFPDQFHPHFRFE